MAELLGLHVRPETPVEPSSLHMPNTLGMQAKLVKADFHGSILSGVLTAYCYEECLNNSPNVQYEAQKIRVLSAAQVSSS